MQENDQIIKRKKERERETTNKKKQRKPERKQNKTGSNLDRQREWKQNKKERIQQKEDRVKHTTNIGKQIYRRKV